MFFKKCISSSSVESARYGQDLGDFLTQKENPSAWKWNADALQCAWFLNLGLRHSSNCTEARPRERQQYPRRCRRWWPSSAQVSSRFNKSCPAWNTPEETGALLQEWPILQKAVILNSSNFTLSIRLFVSIHIFANMLNCPSKKS